MLAQISQLCDPEKSEIDVKSTAHLGSLNWDWKILVGGIFPNTVAGIGMGKLWEQWLWVIQYCVVH